MADLRRNPKAVGHRRSPRQSFRSTGTGSPPLYSQTVPDVTAGPYLGSPGPFTAGQTGAPVERIAVADPLLQPGPFQVQSVIGTPLEQIATADPLLQPGPKRVDQTWHEHDSDLLLHFDDGEGSGTFIDDSVGLVSVGGKTVTANGGMVQRTASAALGSTSGGEFDGTDDFLSLADDPAWDILQGGGDFFIEARVKHDAFGGGCYVAHAASATNQWNFFQRTSVAGAIGFYVVVGGTPYTVLQATGTMSTGTFYTVAVERWLGVVYLYIDGVIVASGALTNTDVFTGTLYVGGGGAGPSLDWFNGDMDELRIQRGPGPRGRNYTPKTVNWTH